MSDELENELSGFTDEFITDTADQPLGEITSDVESVDSTIEVIGDEETPEAARFRILSGAYDRALNGYRFRGKRLYGLSNLGQATFNRFMVEDPGPLMRSAAYLWVSTFESKALPKLNGLSNSQLREAVARFYEEQKLDEETLMEAEVILEQMINDVKNTRAVVDKNFKFPEPEQSQETKN